MAVAQTQLRCSPWNTVAVILAFSWALHTDITSSALASDDGMAKPAVPMQHPWRPPFGLERVGQPIADSSDAAPFEADAIARPDRLINPVDLGAILPPSDWLLLADGQKGTIDVAAISRTTDVPEVHITAWFNSMPAAKTTARVSMVKDRRAQVRFPLPPTPATVDRDVLHISVGTTGKPELWHKKIETMVFHHPPQWPAFGAVETKLRYDAPISVRADDGKYSSINYANAWDPKLQDVVVTLPNGLRFVFWRGSNYIPFWASRHNVGFNYEWAENTPPADGVDCVEPLMDKELRYGRVRIVESTASRIHVRWSYQSCDFNYKVWGDSAVEDY